MRRAAGFTLVELMIVVALISVTAAVAVKYSSKWTRGNRAGELARALITQVHEARETALQQGQTTRLRIVSATNQVVSERWDPTVTKWISFGGIAQAPAETELCRAANSPQITSQTPTCPAQDVAICFASTGKVSFDAQPTGTTACPTTIDGATLFFHSTENTQNPKKYKVVIFKLTGLSKVADQW
jgi:type IV fimbrial biogenesis protein FimT